MAKAGAYIAGAYFLTASTSFANPAVTAQGPNGLKGGTAFPARPGPAPMSRQRSGTRRAKRRGYASSPAAAARQRPAGRAATAKSRTATRNGRGASTSPRPVRQATLRPPRKPDHGGQAWPAHGQNDAGAGSAHVGPDEGQVGDQQRGRQAVVVAGLGRQCQVHGGPAATDARAVDDVVLHEGEGVNHLHGGGNARQMPVGLATGGAVPPFDEPGS